MLDSPDDVCAGQARFQYPTTSVPFSNTVLPTAIRTTCSYPATAPAAWQGIAITDDRYRSALLSTRNLSEKSSAPGRSRTVEPPKEHPHTSATACCKGSWWLGWG